MLSVIVLVAACASDELASSFLDSWIEPNEDLRDQARETALEEEEWMRICMADGGFEYVPVLRGIDLPVTRLARAAVLAGADEAFAEEFGYGVAALHAGPEDPNGEIFRKLSGSDANAYIRLESKCLEGRLEEFETLGRLEPQVAIAERIEALDRSILADERVQEELPSWVLCMSQRGYNYATLADPVEDLRVEIPRVLERFVDDTGARALDFDDALADLRDMEVQVASDDIECRRESGIDQVVAEARNEMESTFTAENRELIERYYDVIPDP